MKPAVYNFTVYQGSTWDQTFTWFQPDGVTPVNLTGCTARIQGRAKAASTSPVLFELTSTPAAGLTLGGTAGTVRVVIADELSDAWNFKRCAYDLEIAFPDGTVQRLLMGSVTVDPEVTR